jgi:cell wall-associated NlpC family hydrolase
MNLKLTTPVVALTLALLATVCPAGSTPTVSSVEAKMVAYAHSKLGQKVDSGECTDLVNEALRIAHARPGDFTDPANYHWGRSRGQIKTGIKPGDIIQFENCVFKSTETLPNGGTRSSQENMPHHTAIVRNENGHHVHIYHQNSEGDLAKSVVHETSLDLRTLQTGHYTVWSPVPLKKAAQ